MKYIVIDPVEKDLFRKVIGEERFQPMKLVSGQYILPASVLQSENFPLDDKEILALKETLTDLKQNDLQWKADYNARKAARESRPT